MTPGLLSWGAQIAAHAAYVERIQAERPAPGPGRGHSQKTHNSAANREALLHALRDGREHRFADLVAALPNLTTNGIYYLIGALRDEGRIALTRLDRGNRRYRLT